MFVCVCVREREIACVCCLKARERLCVCALVESSKSERERVSSYAIERECVCLFAKSKRERESVCRG